MVNYKTIYTLPFKSRKGVDYLIDIQKENYDGESFELTGSGESPFSVEIESEDFLYTPIRFSTATIRVVGDDYLRQLYSTAYQQYRVTFKRNGVVAWCGFIKPEVYSQDYSSGCFELEIECASAMSVLEFVNYKQLNTESKTFVSLWSLIKECIALSRGQYSGVYLPHVYAKDATDYANGANVLAEMTVSEQNFFDEDDKPMKLKEVLEEICKLLNWTCADYLGALYFVDVDYTGEYYRYTPGFESYTMEAIGGVQSVQRIGFSGSEHTLDFLSGYNKATVKTSNYSIGALIPEETFAVKEMYDSYKAINDGYTEETYVQGMILDLWKAKAYGEEFPLGSGKIYELTDNQVRATGARMNYNMLTGASAYKVGTADAERNGDGYRVTGANYSWKTLIRYRVSSGVAGKPILVAKGAVAPYTQGAIGIEANILFTTNYAEPHKVFIQEFHVLRFSLKIGENYWNGASWQTAKATFDVGIGEVGKEVERTSTRGTKTADMPYEGLTGYIVEFPEDSALIGELELVMYAVNYPYQEDKRIGIVDIENLKLTYQKKDDITDEGNNSDRYYENVINEDYINELDEIEFKISSYNNDGACYSKVLLGKDYLTNNLYSAVMGKQIRPEEQLIHRIVNRYNATNIKLTQVIRESPDLTPITRLSDKYMGDKVFISTGGLIDYSMDSFQCVMIQL